MKDYVIEFYATREWKLKWGMVPVYVKQWYWHIRYKRGAIDNLVADGGEGYYNKSECKTSYYNLKRAMIMDNIDEVEHV